MFKSLTCLYLGLLLTAQASAQSEVSQMNKLACTLNKEATIQNYLNAFDAQRLRAISDTLLAKPRPKYEAEDLTVNIKADSAMVEHLMGGQKKPLHGITFKQKLVKDEYMPSFHYYVSGDDKNQYKVDVMNAKLYVEKSIPMSKVGHVPEALRMMDGMPAEKATLAVETDLTTKAKVYMIQMSYKNGPTIGITLSRFINDALDKGCELSAKEFDDLDRLTGVMDSGRSAGKDVSEEKKSQKPTRSSGAKAQ